MEEFEVSTGIRKEPFTCLLYGPPKSGKSFLANTAPSPLFLDAEKGTGQLDTSRVPISDGFALFRAIEWASRQPNETIVIDSLTAIQKMLVLKVCKENGQKNIEGFGFGKGYQILKAEWARLGNGVTFLKERNKNVILIAHSLVKPFADPMSETYDRYELDVDKNSVTTMTSLVDAIFFLRPRTMVRTTEDEKRKIAVGSGRELHTAESPAFTAGNRFSLKPIYIDPGADVWADIIDSSTARKASHVP